MSATEEQSTRQRQREQGGSQRQQRRADSDHRRRSDDEQEKKSEKKSEEKEKQEQKKPDVMKKFAGALPLIFGLGFCVAFFVWVCMQMAGQTVGGPPLLLGIFGGSILGILVAGAGVGVYRLTDRD